MTSSSVPRGCQARRSGFAYCSCNWNRLAEQKPFSAYARFSRPESLPGCERESFSKSNEEREENWYTATDEPW
jgi:hypothetical protein